MPRSSPPDSPPEDESPACSITDVLCREVGASHPDGALKQIRTMKRLLRSRYRVQQRLERHGVDSLEDAVSRIAALEQQVERMRTQQRQRARQRLTIIESLLEQLKTLGASAPRPAPAAEADPAPAPLQTALDLVDALSSELDELRLDLWVYQSDDPTAAASEPHETAADLLNRLNEALQTAQQTVPRLHEEHKALQDENNRLQRETERLRQTVHQQQQRIDQLERETPPHSPVSSPNS